MSRRWISLTLGVVLVVGCTGGGPVPVDTAPPADGDPSPAAQAEPTQPATAPPADLAFAAIPGAELLIRGARDADPAVSDAEVAALARANAGFALDLYRALAAGDDGNLILGPHSISSALAMVYVGARGRTAAEMAAVLHFDSLDAEVAPAFNALDLALGARSVDGVDLRIANQLFAQPGVRLLDSFLTTLSADFGAPLAELDFDQPEVARQVINGWASDRTNDRIKDLFPPGSIDRNVRLVIANAVSLDAEWRYRFERADTRHEPFHLPDGSVVSVPTMHFDLYLPLAATPEYEVVELPYGDGDLSMVVILPEDLGRFEASLDPERLERIFAGISEQGIHLSLPKFALNSQLPLDDTLKALGMRSAYDAADFSGMTGSPDLFVSTVQHQAFIEVDTNRSGEPVMPEKSAAS